MINILYLEDNEIDFELVKAMIKDSGIKFEITHAANKKEFINGLKSNSFDIILCDFSLPDYNGMEALNYVQDKKIDSPFIFVSGTLGEEAAIETLLSGATDYVLKQSLSRLVPAIQRAIKEQNERLEKKHEQEIRRKYDFIVNTSRSFMILIDENFRYEAVNEAFCAAHDLTRKEIIGKSVRDVWGKETYRKNMEKNLQTCLSGFEINFEEWLETKNRGSRCFKISYFPYSAKENKITHIVEVSVDITEKKRTEIELRNERDRAQKYLDIAGVIFIALDSSERVTLINKKGKEIFKCAEEDVLGKNWFNTFIPKTYRKELRTVYQKLINGESKVFEYIESPILTKDKKEKIIAWYNTVLNDEHGNVTGVLISGENITERKRAEESLRASEERYRTLVESSGQSIISVDKKGDIIFFNRVSQELLQIDRKAKECNTLWDVLPKNLADNLMSNIQEVVKSKKPKIVENKTTIKKRSHWFEWRLFPIKDNSKQVDSVFAVTLDVTERKNADVKLKQSYERLQKTFRGIVSALTSTIEIRDPYTAGHQRRVAELACKIAEEMGAPDDQIEGIRIAALVHDIGKIYVPTEILIKPGELSQTEFDLIKIHPQAGYDILKSIDFPWPIAKAILQHHEKIDGTGYPNRLKGNKIILEAKIICVADVIETMASFRPYRPARGLKQAIREITENRGNFYDPAVVDACLKLHKEKMFQFLEKK
ncbi:hypothetical protein B6I21_08205 [candidate division KSB1 bacterium 4572_119]|nr:MAG: hypothetical protein B6I21_08205 [candidate division KSB1 bacterium 4572_119]